MVKEFVLKEDFYELVSKHNQLLDILQKLELNPLVDFDDYQVGIYGDDEEYVEDDSVDEEDESVEEEDEDGDERSTKSESGF